MTERKTSAPFWVIILATITVVVYLSRSLLFSDTYENKIIKFESKYKSLLETLTDSLRKMKSLDTNYVFQILPKFNNKQEYYYLTPDNKRGDYFTPQNFKLTSQQVNFFNEANTVLEYSKKENAFYLKPFYFKEGDKTLLLRIKDDSTGSSLINREFYTKRGAFTYFIVDAW